MKNRDYKNFKRDQIYHIYNRGVNKAAIFLDYKDYLNFLKRLNLLLSKSFDFQNLNIKPFSPDSFSILGYCLMPNHFHIQIRQNSDIPISLLVNKLLTSYVKYFNRKHDRIGQLFQDTFKSKLVEDDRYMLELSKYIHLNPGKGSLWYPYSSLQEYLIKDPTLCDTSIIMKYFNNSPDLYKKFLGL